MSLHLWPDWTDNDDDDDGGADDEQKKIVVIFTVLTVVTQVLRSFHVEQFGVCSQKCF